MDVESGIQPAQLKKATSDSMPDAFTARSSSTKINSKCEKLDATHKASKTDKKTYSQEHREEEAKYAEAKKLADELVPPVPV
jgi:hypothetical protein